MQNIKKYKVAFVGWNPFQFLHIKALALAIPNAVFILEKRKNNNVKFFSKDILDNQDIPVWIYKQKNMLKLDALFDIVITQSMFENIHKFEHAKIVMLQYGYGKEVHNYGTWRALSSLCLVYGAYAAKKIEPFCPVEITGNPRYEKWHDKKFHVEAKKAYGLSLDRNMKTILYMPTWGDISSYDTYIDSILELSISYNIMIKLHHNSDLLEYKKRKEGTNITFFGANDENLSLLALCDIVVCDYGGAMFDALYCQKSIVLLDIPEEKLLKSRKVDKYSFDFVKRDKIGIRISSPSRLAESIDEVLRQPSKTKESLDNLKEEFFLNSKNTIQNVITALEKLMDNVYIKNQRHEYIQQTVVELQNKKCFLGSIKKEIFAIYYYMKSRIIQR